MIWTLFKIILIDFPSILSGAVIADGNNQDVLNDKKVKEYVTGKNSSKGKKLMLL